MCTKQMSIDKNGQRNQFTWNLVITRLTNDCPNFFEALNQCLSCLKISSDLLVCCCYQRSSDLPCSVHSSLTKRSQTKDKFSSLTFKGLAVASLAFCRFKFSVNYRRSKGCHYRFRDWTRDKVHSCSCPVNINFWCSSRVSCCRYAMSKSMYWVFVVVTKIRQKGLVQLLLHWHAWLGWECSKLQIVKQKEIDCQATRCQLKLWLTLA